MASNSYTPTYSAPVAGPGDGRPAVPPGPVSGVPGAQAPVMSDAQLGFQPSQAPALDASVSQFVAPSILNRYRQTAGGRAFASNSAVTTTAVPVTNSRRSRAMGGPEQMSGSVVANLDSLSGPPVSTSPAVYAGVNGTPSSVVFFPGDTTVLNAAAKAQVRAAAASFRASGSTGFIRVVGHASSRTGNMPLERHLVVIFEKSQQRANSVAQELIRAGVPADKVLVEAVGDSQPVFYESMPKGEDGNRRAEIFVQS
jgi:outer membrane protein OmpA-like peptidoglycan-associated protein